MPGRDGNREFDLAWEVPCVEITAISSKTTGGDDKKRIVTIGSAQRELRYTLERSVGRALVAIVERHAPQARVDIAPLPKSTWQQAAGVLRRLARG